MELLIGIGALCLLGILANRYGRDSRDGTHSDEERLRALGFTWGSEAAPAVAAQRAPAHNA